MRRSTSPRPRRPSPRPASAFRSSSATAPGPAPAPSSPASTRSSPTSRSTGRRTRPSGSPPPPSSGRRPRPPKVVIGRGAAKPTQQFEFTPVVINNYTYKLQVNDLDGAVRERRHGDRGGDHRRAEDRRSIALGVRGDELAAGGQHRSAHRRERRRRVVPREVPRPSEPARAPEPRRPRHGHQPLGDRARAQRLVRDPHRVQLEALRRGGGALRQQRTRSSTARRPSTSWCRRRRTRAPTTSASRSRASRTTTRSPSTARARPTSSTPASSAPGCRSSRRRDVEVRSALWRARDELHGHRDRQHEGEERATSTTRAPA
jgi:hypothetical protein